MSRKALLVFALAVTLLLAALAVADNTYSGGVSGTVAGNALIKSSGSRSISGSNAADDGTTFTINTLPSGGTAKVSITEANGNTAISGNLAVTGSISSSGGGASRDVTTPVVLTATSSDFRIAASTADAVTTYTLPASSTVPGKRFCFAADTITGSNREVDIEPQGASDVIIALTNPAGATGIASTAGPAHGAKNTHATAVRGNFMCLQADGGVLWIATSLAGTWAAY